MKKHRVRSASRLFGSCAFVLFVAWSNPFVFAKPAAASPEKAVVETLSQSTEVSPQSTSHDYEFWGLQLPGWSQIAELAILIAVFLAGYSLMTAGKRGWGWVLATFIFGMLMGVVRCVLSMFLELTSDYGPPDWDED